MWDVEAAKVARVDGLVVLLRHAHAGDRDAWDGDDGDRPLDESGWVSLAHKNKFGKDYPAAAYQR